MAGLMASIEKSINANITDIINHANSLTLNSIYEENHNSFDGYQWIAVLDSRTCLVCAALDNQIFDLLPGMNLEPGKNTMPPDEPPLHHHCRCIIVPVLPGMRDDPTQTNMNYEDWFNRQDRETQIDILGPARYMEYINGNPITSFVKDGKIITLEGLELDRIKKIKAYEKIYENWESPEYKHEIELETLYNKTLTAEELQEIFKTRYGYIEIDVANKMPKRQLRLLLKEYDKLLQEYPVGDKLMKIDVVKGMGSLGRYVPDERAIYFQLDFVNGNVLDELKKLYKIEYCSTNTESHVYIHEFAHAIDYAHIENTKKGRQQLLKLAHKERSNELLDESWKYYAKKISTYSLSIKDGTKPNMYGGEFFAESFTAYRNGFIKEDDEELKWIIEFFKNISL